MSPQKLQPWIQYADSLLVDGEERDGWAWLLEVEKRILPSVAERHWEANRRRQAARRHGIPAAQAPERVRRLSLDAQIAAGKRDLVRILVLDRVRLGIYIVDPWPMPEGGWKQGGWKIRFVRRYTPNSLKQRYHIGPQAIRQLILNEPPLPHRMVGGERMQITSAVLSELDHRVEEYKAAVRASRGNGPRQRWAQWRVTPQEAIAVTDLAARSHLTNVTVRRLMAEHPELDVTASGRVQRIPTANLEAWDKIVADYLSSPAGRRSVLNSASSRRQENRSRWTGAEDADHS